jgi:ABC-2 type transport system permease protein
LGGAFLAIGIFISALTENQLISAILTMAALMLLLVISMGNASIGTYWLRVVLSFVSIFSRFSYFTAGIFDFSALLYYASYIFVFLFLTVRVFEKRRWA